MSSVDQIKSKIDIVTLVSSYIKLEKAGSNWKGKCPFHNEKTPSFFVSPDRGSYYCFGCQAKGDIFTFVEEFEGLDFVGALKVLAEKAGVKLERFDGTKKTEDDMMYSVLEQATFFYQKKLSENKDALRYLMERGLNSDTVREFRLGFAPSEWRGLYDFLLDRGSKPEEMLSVGLVKVKEGSLVGPKGYYDTFRGRIIFPIADSSGRVVGFSGRILVSDDKSPKYLNSPETKLFKKSEILFGLDKAKKKIRLKDYSILVEGQMDLVMLHQVGIKNAVASSGTALTQEHLTKLKRLSDRIIMAYDGDSAGFKASDRSAKIALSLGMELKVCQFPEGTDPADMAKDRPEKLREIIKNSKHIVDYYLDVLLSKGLEGRKLGEEIRKNILPYVSEIQSEIEKSHFIKSISQKTFIKEEAIWEDLKKITTLSGLYYPKTQGPPILKDRVGSIERKVFGFLMWLKEENKGNKIPPLGVRVSDIENRLKGIVGERYSSLKDKFEKERVMLLFETEAYYNNRTDLEKELEELLLGLEEENLKKDFTQTMMKLQLAEQSKNSSDVLKYFEECHKISQRINTIKTIWNAYETSSKS